MADVVRVVEFSIGWNTKAGRGAVLIKSADGRTAKIDVASLADLAGWAAILNESNVSISQAGWVHTGPEPI